MTIKKDLYKLIAITLIVISALACKKTFNQPENRKSHPSHKYSFVNIDNLLLNHQQTEYVPVYSDIYHRDGTRRFSLTVTLSVRNTSLYDSAYILNATYYDSYGKILNEYIDSTILLSPLESIEFVVDENEINGGAGANFIVDWGAINYNNQLLIQTVMIGSNGQQGISFISNSKVIEDNLNN